jgi:transposase InsO family protein
MAGAPLRQIPRPRLIVPPPSPRRNGSRRAQADAVVESFLATLEWELVAADSQTRRQGSRALFEYFEIRYNRQRRHSSLRCQTPVEYAAQLAKQQRAA